MSTPLDGQNVIDHLLAMHREELASDEATLAELKGLPEGFPEAEQRVEFGIQMRKDAIAELEEVETALAQAAELAAHVERAAKGELEKKARQFLSLPYAQELRQRLGHGATVLLDKTYDAESLYDATRDFGESLDESFTPAWKAMPKDEHGFAKGRFHVRFVWRPT
ncbi:MAG TPA: hypothetical protein VGD46_19490 [Rhizobacter sp.]